MLCDQCHQNEARVYLTQIINGQKVELHLCDACAKKHQGLAFESHSTFSNFISGLLDQSQEHHDKQNQTGPECSSCQMTLAEFKRTGKFGCDHCYEVFEKYITYVTKSVHGNTRHTGKVPKRQYAKVAEKEKLKSLEEALSFALMEENYMEAASLRDQIRALKGKGEDMNE